MAFETTSMKPVVSIFKKNVTSGGSRALRIFRSSIPLHVKYKKLMYRKKWQGGKGRSGNIVL